MTGYVCGIDWVNAEAMKYWSYPKSYKKDSKTEIKNLIFSGEYYGARKVDGYYQRIVKDEDGNTFMVARSKNVNGEAVNKIEWVPHLNKFFKDLPNGTVLLSEIYIPGQEGSKNITTLLGCLKDKCIERQQKSGNFLNLYIFDVMTYNNEDYSKKPFLERINKLKEISFSSPHIKWATYYSGEELWEYISYALNNGYEGVVITHKDCPVYFKRTPVRMTIKIKKEIAQTIDCFFTGRYSLPTVNYTGKDIVNWKYWMNTLTKEKLEGNYYKDFSIGQPVIPVTKPFFYGWAGSLEIGVLKDGEVVPIGFLSGLTDEIKSNPTAYKNKVIEVSCMEITPGTGGLRHGKFIRFRDDLTINDADWHKVFGE